MDFLASPPDVQLDWNAMTMMVQEHDVHHWDFSHSRPNSNSSSSSSSSSSSVSPFFDDPERWRFGQNGQLLPILAAQKKSTTREMVFRMAAMQPVHAVGPESLEPPKRRRNVRISTDPQSTAARRRRERISERIRILQRLVPGGTKMDTASMLDEAVQYLKFLKSQVTIMERAGLGRGGGIAAAATTTGSFSIEQVFDYEFVNNPMHLLS